MTIKIKLLNHVSNDDFIHGVTAMYKGLIIDIQKGSIPTHVHVPSNDQDSDCWEDTILFGWYIEEEMVDLYEEGELRTLKDYKRAVKQTIDNLLNSRNQKDGKKIQAWLQKAKDKGVDMWNKGSVIDMLVEREFPVVG